MDDEPINPVAEEIEALDRIARTHDGGLLHRYLRRVLENVGLPEVGALPFIHGRRTLARDLMSHMAKGIEGSSGRSDNAILNAGTGRVVSSRRPAGARRVDPDPRVADFLRANGADEA